MSEEKNIHVDSDWKEQVKQEKEKLQQEEENQEQGEQDQNQMPEASFEVLVNLLATQAAYGLGLVPDEKGNPVMNLPVSKLHIDLISVLEEKCGENLSEEEKKHIDETLSQLRMSYVYMTNAQQQGQGEQGEGESNIQTE
ncbi:hypothetical protein L21SP3_02219 [Sedimentisphaera cyanobacteriorum]|uniref:DUF1844 domain-containing protein n=1 Tax=Sedimentisphaera cyanobacteriorum TaxID=1940790 RepID=A0A1Q2HSE5_9BACT|nr:DUF1844 domain-containing protein [Sedimentisphaera cyanobacteriorum]AQQ10387.1 hypothetical protein L21SP3_02219 [Sedimentisphaera cyanobacteriorum]